MSTVADQFAETLAMSGVKRIYGVVGDSLNGITDSVVRGRSSGSMSAMRRLPLLQRDPKRTLEIAKGFTLYMVKAVIGGRAGEVLDLAVTNLWR
jgi:hypothetical protein